nr:immunoglobulin heavy chain junction region [Mus musculus]
CATGNYYGSSAYW